MALPHSSQKVIRERRINYPVVCKITSIDVVEKISLSPDRCFLICDAYSTFWYPSEVMAWRLTVGADPKANDPFVIVVFDVVVVL